MNSIKFTTGNFLVELERPYLFFILIPALLLGIIPFLRIQKKRRASTKHLIPFIIHLTLIFLLSGLLAGVAVTETTDERLETKVVFAVDVSDSNVAMKNQMNAFIQGIIDESDPEKDKFAVVLFANDIVKVQDHHEIDFSSGDYIQFDKSTHVKTDKTNIGRAIERAATLLAEEDRQNKKIIVLSDGLETLGDAIATSKQLGDDVQISGAHFNMVDSDSGTREVQLIDINATSKVASGGDVTVELTVKSTKFVNKAEIVIQDGDIVTKEYVDIQPGVNNVVRLSYTPEVAGVNTIRATINVDSRNDQLSGNNTLYAWYSLDAQKSILIVDGDKGTGVGQFDQIKSSSVMDKLSDYAIHGPIAPEEFPDTLEALLDYDQIVLMDVNFDHLPSTAADNLKRYVEEVGRGLFVSFGDNFYDIKGTTVNGGTDAEYKEIPLEAILPVNLKLEGEKETVAMVMVLDLSSSMKEIMPGGEKSRFEVLVESVKNVLMLGATEEEQLNNQGFDETDYVGVICFDESYHVALDIVQVGDLENRQKICEEVERELRHYYYFYYQYPNGEDSDIPVHKDDKSIPTAPDPNGKGEVQLIKPNITNTSNYDKDTGIYIKAYGTEYKWAVQAASDMLAKQNNKTLLHIKQVLMMSDGEPNTKNNGYVSIVERMSNAGVGTSTISIGAGSGGMKELEKIADAGGGSKFDANDAESLANEIIKKAEEITSELINERSVLPYRNSFNSTVLSGVRDYEYIGGYYTSTIKEGADLILYVDQKKPLYAEWTYGLGKVAVYMSDLGNSDWTGSLFNEEDKNGLILVTNMMNAAMNRQVDSTGLEYSAVRDEDVTTINVTTPVPMRNGETIIAQVFDQNGSVQDTIKLTKVANKQYMGKLKTAKLEETYTVKAMLVTEKNNTINDSITFAVTGYYNEEYNVFSNEGKSVLSGVANNGGGNMLTGTAGFYDDIEKKISVFSHDVTTPFVIAVLVLFLLDILFRNIVIRRKKDKTTEMSDEEQAASMRGR